MFDNRSPKTMEDLFFYEKEQRLIDARKQLARLQETKENLAVVSGITNDAILQKLVDLDIRPETLATLFAIPLLEVAWADGEMQEQERDQLIRYAEEAGLRNKNLSPKLISIWLKRKPDPDLLEAWTHYIQALMPKLAAAERQTLKEEVMADARRVAAAAGGFLGFGKLSEEEKNMLAQLESAFQLAEASRS